MRGRKGFTLVELLVVIIIVGILAAVSIPMMTANVERARRTEAYAALGSLRTAQRVYHSEFGRYTGTLSDLEMSASDIDGRYYNGSAITFTNTGADLFTANIAGKGDAANDWVQIDQGGAFTEK